MDFRLDPILYETLSGFYNMSFDKISEATSLSDGTVKHITVHRALDIYADQ